MSAIIKFHTRKNKNSLLQHSSCSVQTQDYQISLKTRNIFCVAFKACLPDVRAGGSSSSSSWGLWFLQPQSTTKSAHGLFRKRGCCSLASWAWITLLVLLGKATTKWVLFSEIFLPQVFLTVLCITKISIITHVQKILHCCKTSKKSALNLSEEMHQFRLPEGCQALCLQWEPSQGND